jgi:hypothetical protein
MNASDRGRPGTARRWILAGVGAAIIILLLIVLREEIHEHPPEKPVLQRDTSYAPPDTAAPALQEVPKESVPPPPAKPPKAAHSVPHFESLINARVDTWADWNSLFSDTIRQTYSALLDSARLDTLPGARIALTFRGGGADRALVKRVFCKVESVRVDVKYMFPGEAVDFSVAPGFLGSVFFHGALQPRKGVYALKRVARQSNRPSGDSEFVPRQIVLALDSPPGFAYTVRTGIECLGRDGSGSQQPFFTSVKTVEFPRMVKISALARAAADTVLILSNNPRAIHDVAEAVPAATVLCLLISEDDIPEEELRTIRDYPNARLRVGARKEIDASFVVLNRSQALIEDRDLDPEFKRIAELCLKEGEMDRIGYPRVTRLVGERAVVQRLERKFRQYWVQAGE